MRKNFVDTILVLREMGLVYDDQSPCMPDRLPQYDDEDPCGFSVFRMGIEKLDLSNLDMRRTFFSRSEISQCKFSSTDLSESNLCWNDFIDTDFSNANLCGADMRASIYEGVNFSQTDLSSADMRCSDFKNCNFEGAAMVGAKLTRISASLMILSEQQRSDIDWQASDGDEPAGG